MKHLLRRLSLDRADAATTSEPLGRVNSTLCEEMGESDTCELPQKLSVFLLLMEDGDCVSFLI